MLLGHHACFGGVGAWDGRVASGEPVGEGTEVETLVGVLSELRLEEAGVAA